MTRGKMPPYASDLIKLRKRHALDNPLKNANLYAGAHAWQRCATWIDGGADHVGHLIFPSNSEPGDFRWTILAGLTVTILHASTGPDSVYPPTLEQLAESIILDGAKAVYIVDPKFDVKTYPKKATA